MGELLDAALGYARRGWAVLPVFGPAATGVGVCSCPQGAACASPAKHPRTPNGLKDATTDAAMIREWWERWPSANIGIRTGGPGSLLVIDVDVAHNGDATLAELEAAHGEIRAPTVSTGSGGLHLYLRAPATRNTAGAIGPGIDTRGEGGYVVAPPSRHASGGVYHWTPDQPEEPTPAPGWLLELLRPPTPNGQAPPVGDEIPAGSRSATLTSLAGSMRRRGMSEAEIAVALLEVNARRCRPPLSEAEVRGIAESVARYPAGTDAADSGGLDDTANAARLVALHGDRLHYIPAWGAWIVWDSEAGRWAEDRGDVRVRELGKDIGRRLQLAAVQESDDARAKELFKFGRRSLMAHGISGMVDLARGVGGIPLDHERLDANPWVLNLQNGVLDLKTGTLQPADPAHLLTMQAPVAWNEDAAAPRWEQALREWFVDPALRGYVQRVAGYTLVGAQAEHVFIVHYGTGGNGKTTLCRAIQRVLGPYSVEVHLSLLVETRYPQHDTVRADLFRRRLAIAVETDRRVKLAEASVKNLTGSDRIRARRMREDPWAFDPSHTLWLASNHLPEISGRDEGIWRRVRVIKWESSFAGHEDKALDTTLADEAPGILRWLVEGCLLWQQQGLAEPEPVIRETLAYRSREDVFARFAGDAGLVFQHGLEIGAGDLQQMLADWATSEGIDKPAGLGDWLRERGAEQKRSWERLDGKRRQRRVWLGIGLAADTNRGQTDAW
jgi:putative DNA primase/helicase